MTLAKRIRVGIVGSGFAASSHVDALRRVPGVEIAGIVASTPERGRAAAERFGMETAFADWRELLADDSIQAVHDCTPNFLHAEVNAAAIEAGKHLLSEKPLAMDSEETGRLVHQADAADVVTGVCFNYRHYPLVREVRARLASGEYGRPHLIHGGYFQDWLLFETDWNWRLEEEKAGASRAMADIGSHWMDLIQHITRRQITEVFAQLDTLHAKRRRPPGEVETFARVLEVELESVEVRTEDAGTVMFRMDDGTRGTFTVSQISAGWKNHLHFEIDTAEAAFVWDQEEPNVLRIGRRDAPNEIVPRDASLLSQDAAALAHFPGGHQEGWPDGLKNLFIEFYAAVRAHESGETYEPTFATFADAHRITQAVEAIVASNRSGRFERVGATTATPQEVNA